MFAGLATLVGGTLALRFRSALGLFLGFSSGAVVGVALFDPLPEGIEQGGTVFAPLEVTTATAAGFALYLMLDQVPNLLDAGSWRPRSLGPASLIAHSAMDGLGLGLAFQASAGLGWIVAFAVLAHDFIDGANTVTLSLEGAASARRARWWLAVDAVVPLARVGLAQVVRPAPGVFGLLLGAFAGFFLYIGASQLLPRSHVERPRLSTLTATVLGMLAIYVAIDLARPM